MAKKRSSTTAPAAGHALDPDAEVPVVGAKQPCPCGSGKRYKACHGRAAAEAARHLVLRPFEGLAAECELIALREFVPAATAALALGPSLREQYPQVEVTLVTVLPSAWPAVVQADGSVLLACQTAGSSGDASRDLADHLLRALENGPGPVSSSGLPGPGPRLQDLIVADAPLQVAVHSGLDFWLGAVTAEQSAEIESAMERVNAAIVPTVKVASVPAAYWARMGAKEHLRWVLPEAEDRTLDALARLRAAGQDGLGPDTRLIGTFRAHGRLVPVWDLAPGTEAEEIEEPVAALAERLADALADASPLSTAQRRARAGLQNRQLTLR